MNFLALTNSKNLVKGGKVTKSENDDDDIFHNGVEKTQQYNYTSSSGRRKPPPPSRFEENIREIIRNGIRKGTEDFIAENVKNTADSIRRRIIMDQFNQINNISNIRPVKIVVIDKKNLLIFNNFSQITSLIDRRDLKKYLLL